MIRIAHISDTHVTGESAYKGYAYDLIVNEINRGDFDFVIHTGDVTNNGLREEYERASYELRKIRKPLVVVPGNHDVRNVGYALFERFIGPLNGVFEFEGGVVVWVDSTIPDLSDGRVGGHKFRWLKEKLEEYSDRRFKIVAAHHHLIPLPDTGRERNVLYNAGDVLDLLLRHGVTLYTCGHKHVPNVYRVEDLVVDNAGCASCRKTRRGDVNSYNVITLHDDGRVEVEVRRVTREVERREHRPVRPKLFVPRGKRLLRVVQVSESNVSDRAYFRRKVLENAIRTINERLNPDLVVHCGDVVDMGIERYYERAVEFYEKIRAEKLIVPGHNDITYLGHDLFTEYFGEPEVKEIGDFTFIPVVSAQYETPIGVVGRIGQRGLEKALLENSERFTVVVMHHNIVPIPRSRELGFLEDAGDVLRVLTRAGANLVLTGHGGNAFGVKVEKTPIINAGSISWELHRNPFGNSFNVIDVYRDMVVAFEVQATWGSGRLVGIWKTKGPFTPFRSSP
ncbi:metallophosphoesterase 4 [Thermococcus cleftensis]|uniref:Metallophosphoesterase 4 n=1 Tax=Thermococcus cleftensis (strain DSM 27260 / KACC 17922 / CL1) TaxID=163003 RepID=I3ZWQ3_THECF|nr:metallophosphoesterase [Thermococcus cleftensis]AFL96137.1 metallophosphoesterase 4 [Thermococcus cleftensis]